jgi:hypothetical protein
MKRTEHYLSYNSIGEDTPPICEDCSDNKGNAPEFNNIDCYCISKVL